MRDLPDDFKAHLESGTTTLCLCWRVERADEVVQGFTDHDQPLSFDGLIFEPRSGFSASEVVSNLGLGVDTSEIEGALQSEVISKQALQAGDYDNAKVTIFLVNWQDTEQRIITKVADIGEVVCEDGVFQAELRGLMHKLNQVQGRLFENSCDADLGDSRCRVNLDSTEFHAQGVVASILDRQTFIVSGVNSYSDGWFDRGLLSWSEGLNAGRSIEVDAQYAALNGQQVRIWLPMSDDVVVGDAFSIVAGCDKLFPTCQGKFNNVVNFRGFPHIPGNDVAFRFARAGRSNNGRALVR